MINNIRNHYWIIGGSADVYESASNTIVAADDSIYVEWAANNTTSPIASEAELADVLKPYNLLPAWLFNAPSFIQPMSGQYSAPQLVAYSADARYRKASGGCTIGGMPYLTDPVARNTVASAHDYAVANPGHITDWKLADGAFVQINEAELAHVLQEMATFVQSCFTCESNTLSGINGGTITNVAAIDAAFDAISNVLP